MIIGSGTHTYEVVEGWAKFPDSVKLGYTHGVEIDSEENVYIFHTGTPSIVKFDPDGNFLGAWGEQFEGGAHGFYLHRETDGEYFYVTDTSRSIVVKMTLDGQELFTLGTPDLPEVYGEGRRYVPTDVAVAPNGDIYVSDGYGQSWVHRYNAQGEYLNSWGGKGSEPGQLNCPHGVSIDLRGGEPEIYIADRGNNRIQVFTLEGEHKRFITADMDRPCSFYYYNDEIYFPDLHSRVTIFNGNDELITHLGEDAQAFKQEGWPNLPADYFQTGKFSSPHGVCVDKHGNVYVAEWTINGRVTKLARNR